MPNWTPESIRAGVNDALDYMGDRKTGFIPCLTQGMPISTFPGVLEEVSAAIGEYEEAHQVAFSPCFDSASDGLREFPRFPLSARCLR